MWSLDSLTHPTEEQLLKLTHNNWNWNENFNISKKIYQTA